MSTTSRTRSSTPSPRSTPRPASGLDERIEALQAENKGLVDKAIGAIKAVINTIRELVAMLTNVLARAAGVVGDIVKDPIGFLGNLIAGVKGGILKFKDNIVDHLRKGLMELAVRGPGRRRRRAARARSTSRASSSCSRRSSA